MEKRTKFLIGAISTFIFGGVVKALISDNRKLRAENKILKGELINSRHFIKGLQRNNEMLSYNLGKLASEKRNNKN